MHFHGTSNSVDNNSVLQDYSLKTDKSYFYQPFLLSHFYTLKPFRDTSVIMILLHAGNLNFEKDSFAKKMINDNNDSI